MAAEQTENFAQIHQRETRMLEDIIQTPQKIIDAVDIKVDLIMETLLSQHADLSARLEALLVGTTPGPTERDAADSWLTINPVDASTTKQPKEMSMFDMIERKDSAAVMLALLKSRGRVMQELGANARTLLHAAVTANDPKMVRMLVKMGAEKNAEDSYGFSPLHLAAKSGATVCARALVQLGAGVRTADFCDHIPRYYAQDGTEMAWILDVGSDINAQNENGVTALWQFSKEGDCETVKSLLDQGASPDISPENAPLSVAARGGYLHIVELLLGAGASVNAKSTASADNTPLADAAMKGHFKIVQRLIEAESALDSVNAERNTPLLLAIFHRFEDIALLLIESGADVRVVDRMGFLAIHRASIAGLLGVVKTLCERLPLQMNFDGHDGWTPITEAAYHGQTAVVSYLIDIGADADIRGLTNNRGGAIHRAVQSGHAEVVRLLVERGRVDVESRDAEGKTALQLAAQHNKIEIVETLIALGADPTSREWTMSLLEPIHWASLNGSIPMIRLLLSTGKVDVNVRNGYIGRPPLWNAVLRNHLDAARALLEAGADANLGDESARNNVFGCGEGKQYKPLNIAAINGNCEMMRLLMDGGADVNGCNKDGWTALHEVAWRANLAGMRLLISRGADRGACSTDGMSIVEKCRYHRTPDWPTVVTVLKH